MTNIAIRYTHEFKQTLIDLHEKGHSFKELHEEYGCSLDTIRKWVQAATKQWTILFLAGNFVVAI